MHQQLNDDLATSFFSHTISFYFTLSLTIGVAKSSFSNCLFIYKTLFIKIEYGVVPKKLTLKFRADILSLGVFDYADDESDG